MVLLSSHHRHVLDLLEQLYGDNQHDQLRPFLAATDNIIHVYICIISTVCAVLQRLPKHQCRDPGEYE